MSVDRTRFSQMIPARTQGLDFMMVGVGSVGSNLLRAIISIGASRIEIWDDDIVGPENIAVSWLHHVGVPKVESLRRQAEDIYDVSVLTNAEKATRSDVISFIEAKAGMLGPVIIMSPDSIEPRREVWAGIQEAEGDAFVIDFRIGRYGMTAYSFHSSNGDAIREYDTTMSNVGHGLMCGEKAHPGITIGACPMTLIYLIEGYIKGVEVPFSTMINVQSEDHIFTVQGDL